MSHNRPELNALITRFRESYSSVSMSRESIEEIKPRLVECWQCKEKNAFSCFPLLLGNTEAQVI